MLKKLQVNENFCVHCGVCKDVCFTDVIRWDKQQKIPVAVYKEDCQLCCICEAACPSHAITVIPDWNLKYYPPFLSKGGNTK